MPASQFSHEVLFKVYCPATQSAQNVRSELDNLPTSQSLHAVVPSSLVYCPIGHSEHVRGNGFVATVEKRPMPQFEHVVPSNFCPGMQNVVGTDVGTGEGDADGGSDGRGVGVGGVGAIVGTGVGWEVGAGTHAVCCALVKPVTHAVHISVLPHDMVPDGHAVHETVSAS